MDKRRIIWIAIILLCGIMAVSCGTAAGLPEIEGIEAADVQAEYDGKGHGIKIANTVEGDTVLYADGNGGWTETAPEYTEPGTYTVEYRVERAGYAPYTGSARITIREAIIKGITCPTVTVIYDGSEHGITVEGAERTDRITYSEDGKEYGGDNPKKIEVGEYVIYYRVEREHGYCNGSGLLRILPDIRGRYLNRGNGIIEIAEGSATVRGERVQLEYGADAKGKIDGEAFEIKDNTLYYENKEYEKLNETDKTHEIRINGESVYVVYNGDAITVKADGNIRVIYGGEEIKTTDEYNYCESGEIKGYAPLEYEVKITDGITEITLTKRERAPEKELTEIIVYDGREHTIEFKDCVFLSERESYTEPGKYSATVMELSEKYLPEQREATLVILAEISGIYADGNSVIRIDTKELTKTKDGWEMDGKKITQTERGIAIGGKEYARVEHNAMTVSVGDTTRVIEYEWNSRINVRIVLTSEGITLEIDGEKACEIATEGAVKRVTADGKEQSMIDDGEKYYVLGTSELNNPVVEIVVYTE